MLGNISTIKENARGSLTYGFILGEDGETYFFHKTELTNCTIQQLEDGDSVEFEPYYESDRQRAVSVRKRFSSSGDSSQTIVVPGINKSVVLSQKNEDEIKIINVLKNIFYITNGGKRIDINGCQYNYILAKPTQTFTTLFNLTREFVIVFSDYVSFEPRSLDVSAKIIEKSPSHFRIDTGLHLLISNDSNVENKISALVQQQNRDFESIVVPFSYREFLSGDITEEKVKDRFRKYLFDVDLFAINSPIQKDSFFFGRRDYIRDIASKCKVSNHCGIFGLRRSGKTSCLLAIQRVLEQENFPVIFIPCQSELKTTNWKTALYYIIKAIKAITQTSEELLHSENDYKRNSANIYFEEDLCNCIVNLSAPLTIMFDEIEAITFGVKTSGINWREGDSYQHFWDIIRGFCTKYPGKISIVVAGTNPMINELPTTTIGNTPNPMYGQLSTSNQGAYLPPFDTESTSAMVNTLGGYMGIHFSKDICSKLTYDCGGHPYLIRLFCSCVNKYIKDTKIMRPITVSKAIYEKSSSIFEKSNDAEGFYLMILDILQSCYEKEYNALKILATEGDQQVSQMLDNNALMHLIGYGLIENNANNYAIRFDTIKRYLEGKYQFERIGLSIIEQTQEIETRFGSAEIVLRKTVKNILLSNLGKEKAKNTVIAAMQKSSAITPKQVSKAATLTYKQLFDTTCNVLYFSVLSNIIVENYQFFLNIFDCPLSNLQTHFRLLNNARKLPGHNPSNDAEGWEWKDFLQFRDSMIWLEGILSQIE